LINDVDAVGVRELPIEASQMKNEKPCDDEADQSEAEHRDGKGRMQSVAAEISNGNRKVMAEHYSSPDKSCLNLFSRLSDVSHS
jgi:hypothetical protein